MRLSATIQPIIAICAVVLGICAGFVKKKAMQLL